MWTPEKEIIVTAAQREAEAQAALIETFCVAIQAHVDATARGRSYDSGNSLASYIASTNVAWAAEAQAFVTWRDAVWLYSYDELAKVMNGDRAVPPIGEFIGELPAIKWPSLPNY